MVNLTAHPFGPQPKVFNSTEDAHVKRQECPAACRHCWLALVSTDLMPCMSSRAYWSWVSLFVSGET